MRVAEAFSDVNLGLSEVEEELSFLRHDIIRVS